MQRKHHQRQEQMQVQSLLKANYLFMEGVMGNILLMISGVLILRKKVGNKLYPYRHQELDIFNLLF